MATTTPRDRPKHMGDYVQNALHVIDTCTGIPKAYFQLCTGIILLSGKELGAALVSSSHASGVAIAHRDGNEWSPPVAISTEAVGLGAVIGKEEKDMVIFLNPLSMDRLLKGDGQLKIGADFGFAAGKTGGSVGGNVLASDNAGLATSVIFTSSKGIFLGLEAHLGATVAVDHANKAFYGQAYYGKARARDILSDDVKIPTDNKIGEMVNRLYDKLKEASEEGARNHTGVDARC